MSEQHKSQSLQFQVELHHEEDVYEKEEVGAPQETSSPTPSICGLPLKYVSLVTLAVQNAALTIIMHYSRVSAAPSQTYSAAAAVLLVELLKGTISLVIAFARLDSYAPQYLPNGLQVSSSPWNPWALLGRFHRLGKEVFRPDCWKLAIPAILYVIQNNLQFVAVSNLEAATFQVTYQMKILTTAAFSVVLLRKKLSPVKWLALLLLAVGVGIVQIQSGGHKTPTAQDMNAFKGFMAVTAACFTSGLAGVYFEMVLKNSPGDLWVRNVQLSLFSLLPALAPIVFSSQTGSNPTTGLISSSIFANFGVSAWATVLTQVLGGLLTALVIKYADNILKGFATSLSIVISFLASMALFHFQMTVTFALGSVVVLVATWMYNQPDCSFNETPARSCRRWRWHWRRPLYTPLRNVSTTDLPMTVSRTSRHGSTSSLSSLSSLRSSSPCQAQHAPSRSFPTSPVKIEALLNEKSSPRMSPQPQSFVAPLRTTQLSSSSSSLRAPESLGYPSRPSSALSSHPNSRPSSALGYSGLSVEHDS
ncbi:nucleotide-sugar transporter-domain-containing protein [Irpex rosettiformis]|uniref:Nucleotide-sugar transporter-domain-containing protein n=1 Tax=Irpex rosettiformis TaxID=378272 RepID=A0ACB8TVT4_9APHY|nr:nucleotide-sugar transporter-domain-containing protein [Irpex rosettiformis]